MFSSIHLFLCCFVSIVVGLGQKSIISFSSGALQLAGGANTATLILSPSDWPGVLRAGADLGADFGRVTGKNATVVQNELTTDTTSPVSGPVIIAGTIGKSKLIDSLVSAGKIDVSGIKGQWESFQTQIVGTPISGLDSALVIAGSDKRGTIFGIYDISEQIGVSPWYWFADVAPIQQPNIYALNAPKVQGPPSVKYRGIFLNDEQPALTNWVKEKYGGVGYVSGFYSRVFELLLRLRANYLWPTMWDSMFALDDTKNQPLADQYGIVMGTSHTEPLMRSTKEQTTYMSGSWDWSNNKANVIKFMTAGVTRAKSYESLYTMGMRGSGDTSSPTLTATSLTDVINSQQSILTSVLGSNNTVPKMWCLYKEVGGYYQAGMTVPDDITLLWSDDNSGNMQRLPIQSEINRSGGAGVYYHFDYVGDPRNYKWINTISYQKTWEQMHATYQRMARDIWIVNVGDLKPLEIPINLFLDMAYDMTQFDSSASTDTWLSLWATREFGAALSTKVASIVNRYGRYAARRKYELLDATIYSVTNYNEADIVLAQWQTLVSDAQSIYDSLSATAQPGFFELVLHPAKAGYIMHQLYFSVAKNNLYAKQGRLSTGAYGANATSAYAADSALTTTYHKLLGGKWNHMMDQTHIGYTNWQQPASNSMPGLTAAPKAGATGPGTFCDGGGTNSLPEISLYGPSTRWVDVFSRGSASSFTVTSDPWILTTPSSGTLSTSGITAESRVQVSVNWSLAPNGTSTSKIIITTGSTSTTITVPLRNTGVPSDFHGHVQSDGLVAIESEHFTSSTTSSGASYAIIPGSGRTLSALTLLPITIPSQTTTTGPKLTYNIYLFTAPSSSATMTTFLSSSLNTDPSRPLRYAISVNDATPKIVQYVPTTNLGTLPTGWAEAVEDAGWTSTSTHTVKQGVNVISFWALEPGVVVQRLVLDLGGVRTSYLGPPESVVV